MVVNATAHHQILSNQKATLCFFLGFGLPGKNQILVLIWQNLLVAKLETGTGTPGTPLRLLSVLKHW